MIRPQKVLELGTFTGYSALCVAEALDEDACVHTVEADDELEEEILSNLSKSPHGYKVKLHIGDAGEVMKQFPEESFDFLIIDADKREYPQYFIQAMRLLKPGGFILADNTLWDGHVVEKGKHSSQTKGILEFNDMLMETPGIDVAMIPFRDGITLIRKVNVDGGDDK